MTIKVIHPGLATSIQDLGRPGYYHLGIPISGAMDRLALRSAERAHEAGSHRLVLDRVGRTFAVGNQAPVSLLERPTLWRVLWCLAEGRLESPGLPLLRSRLFGVGWPTERISSRSAAGRVRSAIYTLRKLGLAELLSSCNEGYSLSPEVEIEVQ